MNIQTQALPIAEPTATIINAQPAKKNKTGRTGFILSIIALILGSVPVIGWAIWALGAVLSFIGLFQSPRGYAVAGFVISFIGLIILVLSCIGVFFSLL